MENKKKSSQINKFEYYYVYDLLKKNFNLRKKIKLKV